VSKSADIPIVRARYYFLPDDAEPLPFEHSFGSLNWDGLGGQDSGELGEVRGAPRPWVNGADFDGQEGQPFRGSPAQFLFGADKVEDNCMDFDMRQILRSFFYPLAWATWHSGTDPNLDPPAEEGIGNVYGTFYTRVESGEGDTAAGHFTHILLVPESADIRDDYDEGTPGANYDTVGLGGTDRTLFVVRFVELFKDEDGEVRKRVYLDRKLPTWPTLWA